MYKLHQNLNRTRRRTVVHILTTYGLIVTLTFDLLPSFCPKLQNHHNTPNSIQTNIYCYAVIKWPQFGFDLDLLHFELKIEPVHLCPKLHQSYKFDEIFRTGL